MLNQTILNVPDYVGLILKSEASSIKETVYDKKLRVVYDFYDQFFFDKKIEFKNIFIIEESYLDRICSIDKQYGMSLVDTLALYDIYSDCIYLVIDKIYNYHKLFLPKNYEYRQWFETKVQIMFAHELMHKYLFYSTGCVNKIEQEEFAHTHMVHYCRHIGMNKEHIARHFIYDYGKSLMKNILQNRITVSDLNNITHFYCFNKIRVAENFLNERLNCAETL